jgi:hypothetical protein
MAIGISALLPGLAAILAVGCGGQQHLSDNDGGSSNDAATLPPFLDGSVACANTATDLRGTWDLIGAASGERPSMGTLVLGDNSFAIAFGSTSLSFTGLSHPVVWTDELHGQVSIAANQTPSTVDVGILPLNLGGIWTFTRDTSGCNATLSGSLFGATCTGGVYNLPAPLPDNLTGRMSATKTVSLPSVFGSLGGTWSVSFDDGSCAATFSGSSVTIDCSNEPAFGGSVYASFCSGLVSGGTSNGIAFTGRLQ